MDISLNQGTYLKYKSIQGYALRNEPLISVTTNLSTYEL